MGTLAGAGKPFLIVSIEVLVATVQSGFDAGWGAAESLDASAWLEDLSRLGLSASNGLNRSLSIRFNRIHRLNCRKVQGSWILCRVNLPQEAFMLHSVLLLKLMKR